MSIPLKPLGWLFAWRPAWRDAAGAQLLRIGRRGHVALALALAALCTWNQFVHPYSQGLSDASFDLLMRHRPLPYVADPRIVVIDIDEASLAHFSPQVGRWPWPRAMLADVARAVEAGGAKAVVWDILFADPDTANPASEQAFDAYVRDSRVSFFPVLRLNPANDAQSRLTVDMLNFATPIPGAAGATVSLVAPYFRSIYDSTRMGTFNIAPDADNRLRHVSLWEDVGDRRIPSLAQRLATEFGWPAQDRPRQRLNWPRPAAAYVTTSFWQVHEAARSGQTDYFRQFAGKVVLIGATAPGLFDLKATPLDPLHPGVYVLATAIDNAWRGAFLQPTPPWVLWLLSLALLAAGCEVFRRTRHGQTVTNTFVLLPALLLVVWMASVSVGTRLVDLTVPVGLLTTQFSLGLLFDKLRRDAACGRDAFALTPAEREGRRLQIASLAPELDAEAVMQRVLALGPGVRMWEPGLDGFEGQWRGTPWVLWRWAAPGEAGPGGLAWHGCRADEDLGQAIAHARRLAGHAPITQENAP